MMFPPGNGVNSASRSPDAFNYINYNNVAIGNFVQTDDKRGDETRDFFLKEAVESGEFGIRDV